MHVGPACRCHTALDVAMMRKFVYIIIEPYPSKSNNVSSQSNRIGVWPAPGTASLIPSPAIIHNGAPPPG